MIELEYTVESSLRTAIRASLMEQSKLTPALAGARILGFWLDAEDGTAEGQNAFGLYVLLCTHPSTCEGYNPGYGPEPTRSIVVDVLITSQPDNDPKREIIRALYNAVRSVFETVPPSFVFPDGIQFGGVLLTGGGSAEIDNLGQVVSFTADMNVALTGGSENEQ